MEIVSTIALAVISFSLLVATIAMIVLIIKVMKD